MHLAIEIVKDLNTPKALPGCNDFWNGNTKPFFVFLRIQVVLNFGFCYLSTLMIQINEYLILH